MAKGMHARASTVGRADQGLEGFARGRTLRDRNAQASERVLHAFRGNALHLLGNEELDPEEDTLIKETVRPSSPATASGSLRKRVNEKIK